MREYFNHNTPNCTAVSATHMRMTCTHVRTVHTYSAYANTKCCYTYVCCSYNVIVAKPLQPATLPEPSEAPSAVHPSLLFLDKLPLLVLQLSQSALQVSHTQYHLLRWVSQAAQHSLVHMDIHTHRRRQQCCSGSCAQTQAMCSTSSPKLVIHSAHKMCLVPAALPR